MTLTGVGVVAAAHHARHAGGSILAADLHGERRRNTAFLTCISTSPLAPCLSGAEGLGVLSSGQCPAAVPSYRQAVHAAALVVGQADVVGSANVVPARQASTEGRQNQRWEEIAGVLHTVSGTHNRVLRNLCMLPATAAQLRCNTGTCIVHTSAAA